MPRIALVLRFRDAAIFPSWEDTKDRIFDVASSRERSEGERLNIPADTLAARHVSNMLHVLMGERPVPAFRRSLAQRDESLYAMARGSFVRIEMLGAIETKAVRKAAGNSWNRSMQTYLLDEKHVKVRGGLLYHARLRRHLGSELYDYFLQLVRNMGGNDTLTAQEGIELLNARYNSDARIGEFVAKCEKAGRKPIGYLIRSGLSDNERNKVSFHQDGGRRFTCLPVNAAPEKVQRISGTIIIPLEPPEMMERLRNGSGVATLLEGGFVRIVGVADWSELLLLGAKPVVEGEVQRVSDEN